MFKFVNVQMDWVIGKETYLTSLLYINVQLSYVILKGIY